MSRPDGKGVGDKSVETFANFTLEEWIAALTPAWGPTAAEQFVGELFTQVAVKGSNGYSLPTFAWALLSRLGESAEARVAVLTQGFPEELLAEIARLRREWDSHLA